ncbi:MAG: ThiS family protein [Syntrophorhabdus sp. PtaU1.Bin050]|nr:MAG: ThiS family protein [Syntrophorhabdus sp. PtaU1.Bin050]
MIVGAGRLSGPMSLAGFVRPGNGSMGKVNIEIRLFATFREFLPPGSNMFSFTKSVERQTTVAEIIEELGLPAHIPKIVVIDGAQAAPDYLLKDGDIISIFPPIAGG